MIKTNDMTRREKYLFGKSSTFLFRKTKISTSLGFEVGSQSCDYIAKDGDITRRQFAKQRILRGFFPPPVCGINL